MKNYRITPSMLDGDASFALERIIGDAAENSVITLEAGVYQISRAVNIKDKTNLTLDGGGATLAPYFDPEEGVDTASELFCVNGCRNLTLRNFTVSSPTPVNTAGRIINVTDKYADVKLNGKYPLGGKEQFISGMTFDDTWFPTAHYWVFGGYDETQRSVIAGEIACSAPKKLNTPHEMIGDQTVRVYTKKFDGIEPGMNCNISHSYYGVSAFVFRQSEGVTIEDVQMANYGGFGFTVLPVCRDFTFRRVKFITADREHQPYAINSDGIHLTGLAGSLTLDDCDFDSIGDDSLNVHTQVMTVDEADGTDLKLFYNKALGIISPYWSAQGDKLRIYDPETLELKGLVAVKEADRGNIALEPHGIPIKKGDYVTNDKYYPDVVIKNCRYDRYRSRGMCVQGVNSLLVENCTFNAASTCCIYLSTAFDYWMEAGPLANVTVKNNIFRSDRPWHGAKNSGVIFVRVNGERHQNIKPIHKNICIDGNRFENLQGPPAVIHLTDGVTVRNNVFINCGKWENEITIERCENVIFEKRTEKE